MKTTLKVTQHLGTVSNEISERGEFKILSDDFPQNNVFISFAMPDEKTLFEKLQYKRASYFNFLKIVESRSTNRINPVCPHFTICGGCSFQHMEENFYKNHKIRKLTNLLSEHQNEIQDIVVIPHGSRRKANFEAIKKNDKTFLGFHRHNSRQIINLEICKIIRPEISNLIDPLKKLLNEILENFQKAEFFIVLAENGLDVGLEIQNIKQFPIEFKNEVYEFTKNNDIVRFTFKHGNKSEILYQNPAKSSPFLKFANFEVLINPWAFMQTSREAEIAMINILQSIVNKISEKNSMIDLFSGRGTYTLSLIHNFKFVKAVELSGDSIAELIRVAKIYKLHVETTERDLFVKPIEYSELNKFDLIIINPPRAGAELQSIEIAKSNVRNIIYVSCNPETFIRDLQILEKQYRVNFIQPVDQFIWSNHLEIIVWMEKI